VNKTVFVWDITSWSTKWLCSENLGGT